MAKFRYSMQSILNIKLKMETQAKQEFSMAMNALREEEAALEALFVRRRQIEEESERLRMGTLDFLKMEECRSGLVHMDGRIADQRVRIRQAENNVEKARARLTEVMMERKTHERLREKAFDEYLREENRAEGKMVDELTSYTYGRKNEN